MGATTHVLGQPAHWLVSAAFDRSAKDSHLTARLESGDIGATKLSRSLFSLFSVLPLVGTCPPPEIMLRDIRKRDCMRGSYPSDVDNLGALVWLIEMACPTSDAPTVLARGEARTSEWS